MRHYIVLLHRYVGLVIASFLVVTGLTGALLVWYSELDGYLNRDIMFTNPPHASAEPLSPFSLRKTVELRFPEAQVNWMALQLKSPSSAARFDLEPAAALESGKVVDEVFVDPYQGEILGGREWGNIGQGMTNFMPFIYRVHDSLAIGGIGGWLLGSVAILWLIDCFVGVYLTLPRQRKKPLSVRSWFLRWWPAWKIRLRGNLYQLNFDMHTAASLWLWLFLGIFALSSVALTLYSSVYKPVISSVVAFQGSPLKNQPKFAEPLYSPPISWENAFKNAQIHMEKLAQEKGFEIFRLERMTYNPKRGVYKLMATTSRDVNERFGQSWIFISAQDGQLKGAFLPTEEAAGDTFTTWITSLHIAAIWGLPYRIFVSFLGVFVVLLSATGALLWLRKRKARKKAELVKKGRRAL